MELDIPSISAIVAAIGVLIGVVFTVLQLRDLVRTRHTDLVMRLYSTWQSKEFSEATLKVWNLEFKDYDDFVKKYGPWYSETEVYTAFRMVCNFFDGIGILLIRKLVDIEIVASMFARATKTSWEKVKLLVEDRRQIGTTLFTDFEYLYNEIKKREQQLASKTA